VTILISSKDDQAAAADAKKLETLLKTYGGSLLSGQGLTLVGVGVGKPVKK
jgi:hypothetical protein